MNPFQNPNPSIRDLTDDPEIGSAMRKVTIEQLRPACFLVSLNQKPLAEFSELGDAQNYAVRWGWKPSGKTAGPPTIIPPRNSANESRGSRNVVEIVEPWKGCHRVTVNSNQVADWCRREDAEAHAKRLGWRPAPGTAAANGFKKRLFNVLVDSRVVARAVPQAAASHYTHHVAPQLRQIGRTLTVEAANEVNAVSGSFKTVFA